MTYTFSSFDHPTQTLLSIYWSNLKIGIEISIYTDRAGDSKLGVDGSGKDALGHSHLASQERNMGKKVFKKGFRSRSMRVKNSLSKIQISLIKTKSKIDKPQCIFQGWCKKTEIWFSLAIIR